MKEFIQLHEEYEDHMFVNPSSDNEMVRFFVVSNHLSDKAKTEVAEVWLSWYNLEELRDSLTQFLSARSGAASSTTPTVK